MATQLDGEQELHMQTAFLLSSAVDASDPISELKEKITLHNITEYSIYDGTVKALLALSSNAIRFSENTKTSMKSIQPTVFVAFSNSLRHPAHDAHGQSSVANFLATQRQCGFPGAAACNVHGHALAVLEGLPLGTIFSLLGQGYKLVATGYKFGGVVAHLFAARVLLQLQQEVQMARQMGISLTMSLAGNKVSSYAFGSPFFATSSMGRVLASLESQQGQGQGRPSLPQRSLHTIWRAGDGSPAFFAAASELFTVAAAARDAADAAAADGAAGDGDDGPSGASIARTPQVLSVQEWCRFVADGVDAVPRCRGLGPSRLLARPVDPALLGRLCMPGGLFVPPAAAPSDADGGDKPSRSSTPGSSTGAGDGAAAADGGAAGTGAKLMARARGLFSRTPKPRSVESGMDGMGGASAAASSAVSPAASRASSPSPRSASRSRRPAAAAEPTGMVKRTGSVVSVVQRTGSVTAMLPPLPGRTASVTVPKAKPGAWRDGLVRLLQVMSDGLGERYAPVGQFWVVGSISNDKPAAASSSTAASATTASGGGGSGSSPSFLQPVEGARAMQSSAAWLSPGNAPCLFTRWEAELAELQRDLMEAFPWVSFRPTVEVRGAEMDRRELLRASASLKLAAS